MFFEMGSAFSSLCEQERTGDNVKSLIRGFLGGTFWPWKRRLWRDYREAFDYLSSLKARKREEIETLQLAKVQSIWQDASVDVPYYRNLVRDGGAPREIGSWDDFHNLPELNRGLLQSRAGEFRRISGGPDFARATGGSTGNPLRFGMWKSEDEFLRILKLSLWLQMGYTPDERLFLIWGHAHLLGTGLKRILNQIERKAKDRLAGYRRANAYVLSPSLCTAMAKQMIRFKPCGLIGYAAALDYFARNTEQFHSAFRKLQIRFVMPCAEPPPRSDTFAVLREAFGAPIVQEFGGVDFGQVGSKIDEEPFRMFSDSNILEAVTDSKMPGGPEAALVTTLYRRYLPLIRYRQGDVISGSRRLGNGHVYQFEELTGRQNDMLLLSGGAYVHSEGFMHCLRDEPVIVNAQLIVSDESISLRVVSKKRLDEETVHRVRDRLGRLSPELKSVAIAQSVDLETNIAGKRRWFIDKRSIKAGR